MGKLTQSPAFAIKVLAAGGIAVALVIATLVALSQRAKAGDDHFTFVVLPDTQAYVLSDDYEHIMGEQTRWIRDHRDDLRTAFVAQVGDLVESHPNEPQWKRASRYMKVLDDAKVPNSVLPGNHDMDVATGKAPMYDKYFPPSRFAKAPWNSATASYGGYLGQNLFGKDPVDRKNKDSFSLFTAGGMKFLLLNLEYEAPDNTLAWAQKVLDAHPERRVIIATHGFISTSNDRGDFITRADPLVNTAEQVWDKLVFDNCNVFMVVGGHWTDRADPTKGEGRRTDVNACGKPVHQMLSNYQGRPHGGDGWLRYYTFHPATDTIEAKTYSPHLKKYETDADSQFSLSYAMNSPAGDLERTMVASNADWRYRFSDDAPPTTWKAVGFDATSWKKGSGTLGFGTYGPTTRIDTTPPATRPLTAQFRHYVVVDKASALSTTRIMARADDGIVVYINGKEIGRANMPKGLLTHMTYASVARTHAEATSTPFSFTVPRGALKDGTNVLSVEVHSNYRSTPDMTFDLTMSTVVRPG